MVQRVRLVPLFEAALLHDADHVADGECFHLVVGHHQRRDAGLLEDAAHFFGEAFAQFDVEAGERLVQQQQARLRRERARQGNALLLAAGQLVREFALHAAKADQFQHVLHAPATLLFVAVMTVQAEANVGFDVQVRKQREVLEHHADAALLGGDAHAGAVQQLAVEQDAAGMRLFEAGDGAQQGGLAAAGRTDQRAQFTWLQRERHRLHRRRGGAWITDADLIDLQKHGSPFYDTFW